MPRVAADLLRRFAVSLFEAECISPEEAQTVANSLVLANLRGHDSHGVMRIPSYLMKIREDEVSPNASLTILKQTPSIVMADGNWGFGQVQAQCLTQLLIPKAKECGLAVGTLIQTTHVGRLGEYCEMAAAAGLVSQIMVNTHGNSRHVAPVGGKSARLGTNPIAFGVPCDGSVILLDFATSATSEGKVRLNKLAGQPCPADWLLDSDGQPTRDPHALYASPRGTIRPMGGTDAYKGFGLALMIEIFAGALSGGVCMREVPVNQKGNCTFFQFFDPDMFGGSDHFAKEVKQLSEFIRECPLSEGTPRITMPGDPENSAFGDRSKNGIPIDDGNWGELVQLAESLNVVVPIGAET